MSDYLTNAQAAAGAFTGISSFVLAIGSLRAKRYQRSRPEQSVVKVEPSQECTDIKKLRRLLVLEMFCRDFPRQAEIVLAAFKKGNCEKALLADKNCDKTDFVMRLTEAVAAARLLHLSLKNILRLRFAMDIDSMTDWELDIPSKSLRNLSVIEADTLHFVSNFGLPIYKQEMLVSKLIKVLKEEGVTDYKSGSPVPQVNSCHAEILRLREELKRQGAELRLVKQSRDYLKKATEELERIYASSMHKRVQLAELAILLGLIAALALF